MRTEPGTEQQATPAPANLGVQSQSTSTSCFWCAIELKHDSKRHPSLGGYKYGWVISAVLSAFGGQNPASDEIVCRTCSTHIKKFSVNLFLKIGFGTVFILFVPMPFLPPTYLV